MIEATRRAFLTGLAAIAGSVGLPKLALGIAPAAAAGKPWPYKVIESERRGKPFYLVMRLVDGDGRPFFGTEDKEGAEMWLRWGHASARTTVPDGTIRETLTNAWDELENDG